MTLLHLSHRQVKAMDRIGGATLILPWPADLPRGKPLSPDHERDASPAEQAAAGRIVRAECEAHGLVPVHIRVVNVRLPNDWPSGGQYDQRLAVLIIGRRWVRATGRHNPPDLWVAGTDT